MLYLFHEFLILVELLFDEEFIQIFYNLFTSHSVKGDKNWQWCYYVDTEFNIFKALNNFRILSKLYVP